MTTLPAFRPARYGRPKVAVVCHPQSRAGILAAALKGRYSTREQAFLMTPAQAEELLEMLAGDPA